jgi:hypothetical protein
MTQQKVRYQIGTLMMRRNPYHLAIPLRKSDTGKGIKNEYSGTFTTSSTKTLKLTTASNFCCSTRGQPKSIIHSICLQMKTLTCFQDMILFKVVMNPLNP